MADFDPKAFIAKAQADTSQATAFDKGSFLSKAGVAATAPYRSPDDIPMGPLDALAEHFADNVPFSKQISSAVLAAKMKAQGSPMDFGENYRQLLLAEQRQMNRSKAEYPTLSSIGSGAGIVATAATLPAKSLAELAGLGALIGFSDSTANPNNGAGDIALRTGANAVAAPLFGKAVEKVVVPAVAPVARFAGRGLSAAGNAIGDLAGWLKVNSIHPTPTIGEAMATLPGGKAAVGRELLDRGVGGLTKGGTADQASEALSSAGKEVDSIVAAHDAGGGAPIDLRPALGVGINEAQRLQSQPFLSAKAAGKRLEDIVYDYASKHPSGLASASDALALKRELQGEAFGAGEMLKKSGDQLSGHYAKGVAGLAGAIDGAMDSTIGPQFESANLTFRRLLGASNAADRQAARSSANHLLGLIPAVIGGGEVAAGHGIEKASAMAIATALANKYGSQLGARALYSPVRGGLSGLAALMSRAPAMTPAIAVEGMEPMFSSNAIGPPADAFATSNERRRSLASMAGGGGQ